MLLPQLVGSRAADTLPVTVVSPFDDRLLAPSRAFRIALTIPMCGAAGLWAPSCIASAQLAVEQLNQGNGIGGRPLQLLMIDSAVETCTPIEELVDALIAQGSIDAIVGMHISAIRQRLSKVVQCRVPYIYTPLYEGGETTPGIFAIGETPPEQLGPAIERLQAIYRPRRWAMIGNDYVWPRTSHAYAREKLRALGADLVLERYLPFGLPDMQATVEAVAQARPDAVLLSLVGQDAVSFNRAFGTAGLDRRMIRLSCAVEENGLLACGAENLKRLFSSASYFGSLRTDSNAAFRERYHSLHGDRAPMLNALGQSTYEGIHYLAGLLELGADIWKRARPAASLPVRHVSARRARDPRSPPEAGGTTPIYLARADGILFEILEKLTK